MAKFNAGYIRFASILVTVLKHRVVAIGRMGMECLPRSRFELVHAFAQPLFLRIHVRSVSCLTGLVRFSDAFRAPGPMVRRVGTWFRAVGIKYLQHSAKVRFVTFTSGFLRF